VYETYEKLRFKNKLTNARYTKFKFIYDEIKKQDKKILNGRQYKSNLTTI